MKLEEWHDLLYTLGLFGRDWLFVDRVGEAYLTWKMTGEKTTRAGAEDWGPITEEKLERLLSEPEANLAESQRRLIVQILHHLTCPEDFPMPPLPKVN